MWLDLAALTLSVHGAFLLCYVSDARGTAPAALERSSRHVARAVRQALARD
jgi:hypothetical protein